MYARLLCSLLLIIPLARSAHLASRVFTTADGLPREEILDIIEDSRGYLWLATAEGLVRYDGTRFVVFGHKEGLPDNDISTILETRGRVLWVGTRHGNMCRYDPAEAPSHNRFHCVKAIGQPTITSLVEDPKGGIWAASSRGVFWIEQQQTREDAVTPLVLESAGIRIRATGLLAEPDGTLWIPAGSVLYRVRGEQTSRFHLALPAGNQMLAKSPMIRDRRGRLWLGTLQGLLRLSDDGSKVLRLYTTRDGLPDNQVFAVREGRDGTIWLGTGAGLCRFDGSQFSAVATGESSSVNAILTIEEDRLGNLWMGGDAEGLIELANSRFLVYGAADGLPAARASVFLNGAGEACSIGFLVDRATLQCFSDQGGAKAVLHLHPLADPNWSPSGAVLNDRNGDWWIGTAAGLYRFSGTKHVSELARTAPKAIYRASDGLPSNNIFHVFEDLQGDIWIGTQNPEGLAIWRRSIEHFETVQAEGLPSMRTLTTAVAGSPGRLWLGFYKTGPGLWTNNKLTLSEGLGRTWALYKDGQGNVWAACQNGLVRFNDVLGVPMPTQRYGVDTGLSSDEVLSITSDTAGALYLGTPRGLDRLTLADRQVTHFTTADGLGGNYVESAVRDREGRLWFGSRNGRVTRMDPGALTPRFLATPVITGLRIDGVEFPVPDAGSTLLKNVALRPGQNHMEVAFQSIDLTSSSFQYQHMLRGVDRDWSPPSPSRSVSYARLPSGTHEFLVCAYQAGRSRSPSALLQFRVDPPFWQRWWFLSLACALTIALAYLAHLGRVHRLLAIEGVRRGIATDLHDDIGSTLSQIALLSEVAQRQPHDRTTLTRIGVISRELVDSMGDVVWSVDPRRDHWSDLVSRMRRFATEILEAKGIEHRFTASGGDIALEPDTRRHLYLIFKEAVNNVVRHSACRHASIEIRLEHGHLTLRVADDGKGLPGDGMREDGHGLESMRIRAQRLGGSLEINPLLHGGAEIVLRAPRPARFRLRS